MHDDPDSAGVAAVFVDVTIDPRDGTIQNVINEHPFMLFTTGRRIDSNTVRVGGGNLDPGIGIQEWSHVATVVLESTGHSLNRRVPFEFSIHERSIAIIGEGAVWEDDVGVTKLSRGMLGE